MITVILKCDRCEATHEADLITNKKGMIVFGSDIPEIIDNAEWSIVSQDNRSIHLLCSTCRSEYSEIKAKQTKDKEKFLKEKKGQE